MLYKLDDYDMKTLDSCDNIIGKCKRTWVGDYQYIDGEELLGCIEELIYEYERVKEELEDTKQDMEDNYRPISRAEQYEISDRDFI